MPYLRALGCLPHDRSRHAQDPLVSEASLDQLHVSQPVGTHEGKDHVWNLLLLNEDGSMAGSDRVYDFAGIDGVRRVPDYFGSGWKDAVLDPLAGALRYDHWRPAHRVDRTIAIRLYYLVRHLHGIGSSGVLLSFASVRFLAHGRFLMG